MRHRLGALASGALATSSLSLFGMALATRLWRADLSIPFRLGGDVNLGLMIVRNMQTSGWFQTGPMLNAPIGQDLLGYPSSVGDLWNMVGMKVLSLALSPAQTVNAAFLFSFVLIAACAFIALRILRVSAPVSIALGAVYSWLPYHFLRGEGHLFLSNYAVIPLVCVVGIGLYDGRLTARLVPRRWGILATLAIAVLLGGTGLYYAAFGLVLIGTGAVLGSIARRSWGPLLRGAVLGAVTGVVLLASAAPNLLYRMQGGVSGVEGRGYAATEFYGLKLTYLLLPLSTHRWAPFAELRARVSDSFIPGEGSETLGLIGVVGFVAVVLAALLPLVGRREGSLVASLRPLGVFALISFVVATVAGINGLFAVAGFGQLRAWNRMSVVIAFLAVAGVGHLLDAARRAARPRFRRTQKAPWRALVAVATVGIVSVAGLVDQTSSAFVPDYAATKGTWDADARFFATMESTFGPGAEVFQLPIVPFPENPPVVEMKDYDHLRGYLHSDLRWSYAGIKGGPAEWQGALESKGMTATVEGLIATGFTAIYVNRTAFTDNGAAVEAEITSVIGQQSPLVNEDNSLVVFDLRPYAARLAAAGGALPSRDSILYPVYLAKGNGFYGQESADGESWTWLAAVAAGELVNPGDTEQKVLLTTQIRAGTADATVRIRIGDEERVVHLVDGSADVELYTSVPVGQTPVTVTTDSAATPSAPGDTRDLRLRLLNLRITPLS